MTNVQKQLQQSVERWALLEHPFYRAWSAGQLPLDALRNYAREYGAFISLLPQGWQTLGDQATAQEEREHAELWQRFAEGLEASPGEPIIPQVIVLAEMARNLFASRESALGALYAFEVQQPETAQSKLAGLRAFYELPQTVEPYFELHSNNQHEAAKLLTQIEALAPDQQGRAAEACETMSRALWDALSGIHQHQCPT
jgi:pyrroloquinoline-quinone synthase